MRIVFWQNCLSPHQLPYIAHLLDDERVDEVVVVAGETMSSARKDMGWSVAQYEGLDRCKVYVHPHDNIIYSLFEKRQDNSHHLFSGIRADMFVFKCLKISMAFSLKRGIITERPNTYDFKHNISNAKPYWLHRIRFWLQDRKYAKHIQTVFAMGHEAVEYFQTLGMKWQVFPFCYCTVPVSNNIINSSLNDKLPKYLFCGSLTSWKAPLAIVRALLKIDTKTIGSINFIGDGSLYRALEYEVKKNALESKIHLLGIKPQKEVPIFMQQADIFILPSLYDGWGAVVNEALQAGCFVICSDAAGASDLILQDKQLGKVYNHGNIDQLASCMEWCNKHICEVREKREFRKKWAEEHISGIAVAHYMIDCLEKV